MIAALAIAAGLLTAPTCAVIDNETNTAAWLGPQSAGLTQYADMGRIVYATAPAPTANSAWTALHATERALQEGPIGFKTRIRCVR